MIKRYCVLDIFDSDCLPMIFTGDWLLNFEDKQSIFNAFPEKLKSPCKVSSTGFGLMSPQWGEWSISPLDRRVPGMKMLLTPKGKKWVSQRGRAQTPALTAPRNTALWAGLFNFVNNQTVQWLRVLWPRIQFPALRWQLATFCNCSSLGAPHSLLSSVNKQVHIHVCGTKTYIQSNSHAYKN